MTRFPPLALLGLLLVLSGASHAEEPDRDPRSRHIDVSWLMRTPIAAPPRPALGLHYRAIAPPLPRPEFLRAAYDDANVEDLGDAAARLFRWASTALKADEPAWWDATYVLATAETTPADRQSFVNLAGDVLRRVVVDVECRGPGGIVAKGTVRGPAGVWAELDRTRDVALVIDIDPELACDNSGGWCPSVLGNPITAALLDGLHIDVRPFLLDEGRCIALEAVVQAGRFDEPCELVPTGARYLGHMHLPRFRNAVAVLSGSVAPGQTLAAHLDTGHGTIAVRLTPRLADLVPPTEPGDRMRRYDAGLLTLPFTRPATPIGWDAGPAWRELLIWPPEPPRLAIHDSVEHPVSIPDIVATFTDDALVEVDAWGGVYVAAEPAEQEHARQALDLFLEPLSRTVRLDVVVRAGGERIASASTCSLNERGAAMRIGVDRAYLLDADVEVG